jgi:hypothetical protein
MSGVKACRSNPLIGVLVERAEKYSYEVIEKIR